MKNVFTVLRSKGVVASVATAAMIVGSQAHAALPSWASTAATESTTAIADAQELWGPIIMSALAAGILIKLIKRFGNKV